MNARWIAAAASSLFLPGIVGGEWPVLTGPYLGQQPPGLTARVFAPRIISTGLNELNSVFSRDGREFYFCVRNGVSSTLFVTRLVRGAWSRPEPVPFAGAYDDIDVSISPDDRRLFFASNRPPTGSGEVKRDYDLWMSERQGDAWGVPVHLGEAVNSPRDDFYPTVSRHSTLYFNSQREGTGTNDIYTSRWIDGRYTPAEKLGPAINTEFREFDPFVGPDERFLIFTSERPGDDPFGDLYVSFRDASGTWTQARRMGPNVNGPGPDFGAALSPDGRFLFFTGQRRPQPRIGAKPRTYDEYMAWHSSPDNGSSNIWWIDSRVIDEMRPPAIQPAQPLPRR